MRKSLVKLRNPRGNNPRGNRRRGADTHLGLRCFTNAARMADYGVALVFDVSRQAGNHLSVLRQRRAARQTEDQPQAESFLQRRHPTPYRGVIAAQLPCRCRQ
ncbi:hypothetical protein D3C80_1302210 [compost metagenome]